MTGWIAILALTVFAFAGTAFVLRLPREGWAVFGAILLLGVTGYAWQGSPTQSASPKEEQAKTPRSGDDMIKAREFWFAPTRVKPDFLVLADGIAREGKFGLAADRLREGLAENPDHMEGWLALGMTLVAHAEGNVTPAASYAYNRANQLDPANPAPEYFLGISFLQSGQIRAARSVWGGLLERSPEDAPWRPGLEAQVARLDQMIANAPMLQGQ
jgi:cytochrome c-type biogenesis protein CcmH